MKIFKALLITLLMSTVSHAGQVGHHVGQLMTSKNFKCVLTKFENEIQASSAVIRISKINQGKVITDKSRSNGLVTFNHSDIQVDLGWQQLGDGGEGAPMGTVEVRVDYEEDLVYDAYSYTFEHVPPTNPVFKIKQIDLTSCNGAE